MQKHLVNQKFTINDREEERKMREILKDKRGDSTPVILVLVLALLFLFCAMSEFFRLLIITQGVRDGLQQAVISVAISNYDETYR